METNEDNEWSWGDDNNVRISSSSRIHEERPALVSSAEVARKSPRSAGRHQSSSHRFHSKPSTLKASKLTSVSKSDLGVDDVDARDGWDWDWDSAPSNVTATSTVTSVVSEGFQSSVSVSPPIQPAEVTPSLISIEPTSDDNSGAASASFEAERVQQIHHQLREFQLNLADLSFLEKLNRSLSKTKFDSFIDYYQSNPRLAEYSRTSELERLNFEVVVGGQSFCTPAAILEATAHHASSHPLLWRLANQSIYADVLVMLQKEIPRSADLCVSVVSTWCSMSLDFDSQCLFSTSHFDIRTVTSSDVCVSAGSSSPRSSQNSPAVVSSVCPSPSLTSLSPTALLVPAPCFGPIHEGQLQLATIQAVIRIDLRERTVNMQFSTPELKMVLDEDLQTAAQCIARQLAQSPADPVSAVPMSSLLSTARENLMRKSASAAKKAASAAKVGGSLLGGVLEGVVWSIGSLVGANSSPSPAADFRAVAEAAKRNVKSVSVQSVSVDSVSVADSKEVPLNQTAARQVTVDGDRKVHHIVSSVDEDWEDWDDDRQGVADGDGDVSTLSRLLSTSDTTLDLAISEAESCEPALSAYELSADTSMSDELFVATQGASISVALSDNTVSADNLTEYHMRAENHEVHVSYSTSVSTDISNQLLPLDVPLVVDVADSVLDATTITTGQPQASAVSEVSIDISTKSIDPDSAAEPAISCSAWTTSTTTATSTSSTTASQSSSSVMEAQPLKQTPLPEVKLRTRTKR